MWRAGVFSNPLPDAGAAPGKDRAGGQDGTNAKSITQQLAQAFLACRQDLLRYVRSHVRCPELSLDIAQEAFVRALRSPQGSIREPRAFLFRTARNLSIDHLRHQQMRAELENGAAEIEDLASGELSAETALHLHRQLDVLKQAIAELPQKRREIFLLHRFEGASHAELAAMYRLSKNMIEKHVIAAVAHCRQRLQAWEGGHEEEGAAEKAV